MISVDGTEQTLFAERGGVAVTLTDDPLLLLYDAPDAALADSLPEPPIALASAPGEIESGATTTLTFQGPGVVAEKVSVIGPPLWKSQVRQDGEGRVQVQIESPAITSAREARFRIQTLSGDRVRGELLVAVPVAAGQ